MSLPTIKRRPGAGPMLRRVNSDRFSSTLTTGRDSSRTRFETHTKAEHHDTMMQRFQLRKESSDLPTSSRFTRANHIVIDKVGGARRNKESRFSLNHLLRLMTSRKARRRAWKSISSPITPNSWISTIHGILMLLVYQFQLVYLPFSPSYYPNGSIGTTGVASALSNIFILDLVLNLNTSYMEQGMLVTSRRKIARHYVGKWFVLDLLSSIPAHDMNVRSTGAQYCSNRTILAGESVLMLMRLLRTTFLEKEILLSRVMRIGKQMAAWFRYSRYSHLLGIARLLWFVLLIAHYMACFWHVISETTSPVDKTTAEEYITDYYFAITLIQGEANSYTGTWSENLFSSAVILLGSVILAIVFGNVAMLVSNFNANTTNYHRKMEAVYATMDKLDLPPKVRERVHQYYTHVWSEYEALDGDIVKFQQELAHPLGLEVGLYRFMHFVVVIPLWKDCIADFLSQLVRSLSVRLYMRDDYVLHKGGTGAEMMMINQGVCKMSGHGRVMGNEQPAVPEANGGADQSEGPATGEGDFDFINNLQDEESEEEDSSSDDNSDEDIDAYERKMAKLSRQVMIPKFILQRRGAPSYLPESATPGRIQPCASRYPQGIEDSAPQKLRILLYPGDSFAEMSLIMNYRHPMNVRAVTFVEMCVLERRAFQEVISRYPEDRRRVLTMILESGLEKKEAPFPWEQIRQDVAIKRRANALKGGLGAGIQGKVTLTEAVSVLVDRIDVSLPDTSIKFGFQTCDGELADDSSTADAVGMATVRDGRLQRSKSCIAYSRRPSANSFFSDCLGTSRSCNPTEADTILSPRSELDDGTGNGSVHQGLDSVRELIQTMAANMAQMQEDVALLKAREGCCGCHNSNDISLDRTLGTDIPLDAVNLQQRTRASDFDASCNQPSPKTSPVAKTFRATLKSSSLLFTTASSPIGRVRHSVARLGRVHSTLNRSELEHQLMQNALVFPAPGHATSNEHGSKVPHAEPPQRKTESNVTPDESTRNCPSHTKAQDKITPTRRMWKRKSITERDLSKLPAEQVSGPRRRWSMQKRKSMPSLQFGALYRQGSGALGRRGEMKDTANGHSFTASTTGSPARRSRKGSFPVTPRFLAVSDDKALGAQHDNTPHPSTTQNTSVVPGE